MSVLHVHTYLFIMRMLIIGRDKSKSTCEWKEMGDTVVATAVEAKISYFQLHIFPE